MNFLCSYRTFFAVAVLCLSMAMTTACSKDDNDSTPAQPSVNVFASERYTLQQLVEEAGRGRYVQSYLGDNETVLALVENVLKGMSDRRSYRIDTIFANRENVPLNHQDRATFDKMSKGGKIHWKDTYAGILKNVMNGSHQMLTILASFSMVQYNTPAEAFNQGL